MSNDNCRLLVATDIYGPTDAFCQWVDAILPSCWDKQVISPYSENIHYSDEPIAYQAFLQTGGLDNFKQKLTIALKMQSQSTVALGFSAGAAALYYVLSSYDKAHHTQHFYGFYPGQIRFFTDKATLIPSTLYFPNSEPHFDVDTVIKALSMHANVTCNKTEYLHGFMNPYSRNYDTQGQSDFTQVLINRLAK